MTTYDDLHAWKAAHPRASKWANNTYITERVLADPVDDNGVHVFVVRLHNTEIVTIAADRIWFNTGGWNTVTTKARMNEFSPLNIRQKDYQWYVDDIPVHNRWDLVALTDGGWGVYPR
jgi:hypothetical protein